MSLDDLQRIAIKYAVPWSFGDTDDLSQTLHETSVEASAEAHGIAEVLRAGFALHSRCEIGSDAVQGNEGYVVAWRAHLDLGLLPLVQ